MAKVASSARKTKTAKQDKKQSIMNRSTAPFFGAMAGLAIGLPLAAMTLSTMVKSDVTQATSGLATKSLQAQPADALSCVAPAGTTAGSGSSSSSSPSHFKPAFSQSASQSSAKAKAKSNSPETKFITKLVGGTLAKNNASIENNGNNDKAVIVNKNVITNTNTNIEGNTTEQNANSGNVKVVGNYGATGNTSSGDASNANSSSFVENANN